MSTTLKGFFLALVLTAGTWAVFEVALSLWARAAASQPITDLVLPGPEFSEGARLYRRDCAACHGPVGDGAGKLAGTVASLMPRNFRGESFRFISTDNGVAFRADVLRTIRRGIPEVGMPPARLCSAEEQGLLADYVLELHRLNVGQGRTPGSLLAVPVGAEAPVRIRAGRDLFLANCSACHGVDGTAQGVPALPDSTGRLIRPRDLTAGEFHGGATDADLYWRIRAGIPGTAMPAFSQETLTDPQVLDLIAFVRSLSR